MNNKKIDLVVPMYKAKSTLTRLLASVLMQSIVDKIHLILVQDADNEDYSGILEPFKNLLDFEIVPMNVNSGPGTCRRVGMQTGKCEYIMCMDADDTFQNPFAAQELLNFIETYKFDAVNSTFLEQLSEQEFLPHIDDWVWMFGKIYRRSFLEDNKIEMNDSRANEDSGFNIVVRTLGNIGFLDDTTYIWHYKEDSITRVNDGIYTFTGTEGWLYNMAWAIKELERLQVSKEVLKERTAGTVVVSYILYNNFKVSPRADINTRMEDFLSWVSKFVTEVYEKYSITLEDFNKLYLQQLHDVTNLPSVSFNEFLKLVGIELK